MPIKGTQGPKKATKVSSDSPDANVTYGVDVNSLPIDNETKKLMHKYAAGVTQVEKIKSYMASIVKLIEKLYGGKKTKDKIVEKIDEISDLLQENAILVGKYTVQLQYGIEKNPKTKQEDVYDALKDWLKEQEKTEDEIAELVKLVKKGALEKAQARLQAKTGSKKEKTADKLNVIMNKDIEDWNTEDIATIDRLAELTPTNESKNIQEGFVDSAVERMMTWFYRKLDAVAIKLKRSKQKLSQMYNAILHENATYDVNKKIVEALNIRGI